MIIIFGMLVNLTDLKMVETQQLLKSEAEYKFMRNSGLTIVEESGEITVDFFYKQKSNKKLRNEKK